MSNSSMFNCLESLLGLDHFQVMKALHGFICSQATQRCSLSGYSLGDPTPQSPTSNALYFIAPLLGPQYSGLDLWGLDHLDHPMIPGLTLLELELIAVAAAHHRDCNQVLITGDHVSNVEDTFCYHMKSCVWTQVKLFFGPQP